MEESKKSFDYLNLAYGIGAAIVIVGAMFKFLGWEFANQMFLIGLTTEAVVFVISGFEWRGSTRKLDWVKVFPQLDEAYDGDMQHVDLSKSFELYYRNTESIIESVDALNKAVIKLSEVSENLTDSVERLGKSMEKIESSSADYGEELDLLKEKVRKMNAFYNDASIAIGRRNDLNED